MGAGPKDLERIGKDHKMLRGAPYEQKKGRICGQVAQRPWRLFLIQKPDRKEQEQKKGTYTGEMESKKEASVTSKWKESEKNRSIELCS